MTIEEIVKTAIVRAYGPSYRDIAREAARLAVQAERERCSKIAREWFKVEGRENPDYPRDICEAIAERIAQETP